MCCGIFSTRFYWGGEVLQGSAGGRHYPSLQVSPRRSGVELLLGHPLEPTGEEFDQEPGGGHPFPDFQHFTGAGLDQVEHRGVFGDSRHCVVLYCCIG